MELITTGSVPVLVKLNTTTDDPLLLSKDVVMVCAHTMFVIEHKAQTMHTSVNLAFLMVVEIFILVSFLF